MKEQKNSFHFLVYLAILSIVGFLATDMYLPAFDIMHHDLNTAKSNIGLSLTLYLAGFGVGQILWGPIADRFGKPKAIIAGMTLFALTSIGIFFTNSVFLLLVLRGFQAIGACAAAVCWQALVIEKYPKERMHKIFASIMPLVALSPALAPLLGVFLLKHGGWRYIFLVIAAIAILLILYSIGLLRKDPSKKEVSDQNHRSYRSFFKSSPYLGNVLIYSFCSAGFFAWLTGAPFFLKDLGYDETAIGLSFIPQTIAFIVGGYGYRLIAGKIDAFALLPKLLILYAAAMIALLLIGLFTIPNLTIILIPFCFMAFANGAIYPIVVAEALKRFPRNSGKASALQNTIQQGSCFVASAFVSFFSNQALIATCVVMASTVVFVYLGYRLVGVKDHHS